MKISIKTEKIEWLYLNNPMFYDNWSLSITHKQTKDNKHYLEIYIFYSSWESGALEYPFMEQKYCLVF